MSTTELKLQIPASSSNLGPGFDCFGLALNIFNEYKIRILDSKNEFKISSNLNEDFCPNSKDNLFYSSYKALLEKNNVSELPSLEVELNAQIPTSGGFGSSGTAVLAGLMTANKVLKNKFTNEDLIHEACLIEKHPDNVCASMLGEFCLSSFENNKLVYKKLEWKLDLEILILYPKDFRVDTKKAREVLEQKQDLKNCISNLSNSAFFTAAVLTRDRKLLKESIKDHIHEEKRLALIPGSKEIINMAKENFAVGATISGSGASLIVFLESKDKLESIKDKAQEIWSKHKLQGESILCKVSNFGALIY